jgi:WS/DGAT/MGAT family acyltransferase
MTGLEALMWRLGADDPRFAATMSLVVELDGPVPRAALRRRLSRLCTSVPRLAERVQEAPVGVVPPRWEPDPAFSVERHVGEAAGPLWDAAASVVATSFPAGRPPWRVVVASSAPGALVLHLHHSYTDGLGGVRLIGELFDFSAEPAPDGAPGVVPPAGALPPAGARPPVGSAPPTGSRATVVDDMVSEIGRAVGLWTRALPWAGRTLGLAATRPSDLLADTSAVLSSLQVAAGAATGPASALLAERSAGVALAPVRMDLEAARATARRLGAKVNDVFLAGLLDGLERYHAKHGSFPASLRLGLPVSTRRSDIEMHNQVVGAVLRGPLGRLDFDERTRLVHEIVLRHRDQPWAAVVDELAAGAIRIPGAVPAVAAALASLDVLASNVVGPSAPMWLEGVPVRAMTPIGPRSGAAVNATLLSYSGTAFIGLNLDPAAVADPHVLVDCVAAAFDEGLAAPGT